MKNKDENILNVIGIFLITIGLIAIIDSIIMHDPAGIFWFCYLGLLIIGIGILKRNSFLIISQLNILSIPLILWTIDFIFLAFGGHSLFGIVDYFTNESIISKIISLQHLITIPLSFYALYLIKIRGKYLLIINLIYAIIIYLISILLPVAENINCVQTTCANFTLPLPYPITWFLSNFIIIIVTSFLISKMNFLKEKNLPQKNN